MLHWHYLRSFDKGRETVIIKPEHYTLIIKWDSRDNIYIVSVPELSGCKTHGKTYEEAIKNALEVIELWIEDAQKGGEPVPPPMVAA